MVTGLLPVAPGIVGQAAAAEGDGPTFEQAIVTPLPDAGSWNAEMVDHGDLDGDGVTDLVVAALQGGEAPAAAAQVMIGNRDGTFSAGESLDLAAPAAPVPAVGAEIEDVAGAENRDLVAVSAAVAAG